VLLVVAGAAGYSLIEGWSFGQSLYRTILAVTTVESPGPVSAAGRVLTVVLLIAGVSAALYTFTLLATVVVEGGLPKHFQQRRRARMLESLKDHVIICGYGRIGRIVAREFQRQGVPLVVIERDPQRLQAAMADGVLAVEADASREDVLKRVGIERARGLIAAVGSDAENVYAVLTARVLRPDLFIVGRAETEDAMVKLKRAGADRVIAPYQIGAVQMAQTALRPAVVDFVALVTGTDNLELSMEEVAIPPASALAELTLVDANLRQRFGVIVVGIQRDSRHMEFNPPPDSTIHAGDTLVVLGRADSLKQLEVEASKT